MFITAVCVIFREVSYYNYNYITLVIFFVINYLAALPSHLSLATASITYYVVLIYVFRPDCVDNLGKRAEN